MASGSFKLTVAAIACLSVLSFAALPEMKVTTRNNAAINAQSANRQGAGNCQSTNTYSHKYVAMSLTLTDAGNSRNNITVSGFADSIRGRGNSTWAVDKKPYRIKFGEHQSMFGTKKHRSWALLANWYDPTFTLNSVGFELGKRMGLPGTPNNFLVDFYLNNTYKGIYQITDIVQVNNGRVEVDTTNGWLVEFDYHCPSDADEVDFNTDYPNNPSDARLHTYIKSPEKNYQFVKDDINKLTRTMFQTQGFPTNGYRDLIDLESMAKYVLIQTFMDNFDFNNKAMAAGNAVGGSNVAMPGSNFMHKDVGSKMVAGPLWDLDLAAGVDNQQNFPKHYQYYNYPIKPKHPFYAKFYDDPVFLAKLKKNWDKYLNDIRDMTRVMDSIATHAEGSVEKNFALQNSGGGGGWGFSMNPEAPKTKQAYKDEVGKLKTWWNNRITFYQQEINKMNIDTSKDIIDPSSSSKPANSSSSSKPANSSSSVLVSSSSNANNGSVTLSCNGLQATVAPDGTIAVPTLSCSNGSAATNENWLGRPSGNSSWTRDPGSSTQSYNISVTATCGSAQGLSATCGTVTVGEPTPIRIGSAIVLENLPSNTKIEVYNLQGKRIYSGYSENNQILRIGIQTKGVYIVKTTYGVQRLVVK